MASRRPTGQVMHILATYHQASKEELSAGLTWYRDGMDEIVSRYRAYRKAGKITGKARVNRRALAGITAALSPQKAWRVNVDLVFALLMGKPVGQFSKQVAKATAILHGADPARVLTGPKERAFFECLASRETDYVTVDGHAYAIWLGERVFTSKARVSVHEYDAIADDYREAARLAGVSPCQMQAITWVAWRRLHNSRGHVQDQNAAR